MLVGLGQQSNASVWQPIDWVPIATAHQTKHPVFVLRTEQLVQDWNNIDVYLGGNGTLGTTLFRNSTRLNTSKKQSLSAKALEHLCQALCLEIQYYKLSLWLAYNLNATDIQESMDILRQSCPNEPNEIRRCYNLPNPGRHPLPKEKNANWIGIGKPRLIA